MVGYAGCTPDERTSAIDALTGLSAAVHAEILRIVAAANRAEDFKADGATSMAGWLACRYNLSVSTASDWVRAADALEQLPALRAVYVSGAVSFDQVRHVVTFATPAEDAWLAEKLPGLNAAQVKALAQARRTVRDDEAAEARRRRFLRFRKDRSGLGSRVSGFLPTEAAATIEEDLRRRAEAAGADPVTGMWDPYESRCVDALDDLCAADLAGAADASSSPDAAVVVIHADADVVDGLRDANATIDGEPITPTALQRRLCDADVEFSIDDTDGRTLGIGRKSRTIPRWLRRRIVKRDGGCCRWPGCGRPIRHIHHMRHWTRGGPTNAHNLIGVCWYHHHHHLLHEGGWNATGNADDLITFTSPTGRTINARAGPLLAA